MHRVLVLILLVLGCVAFLPPRTASAADTVVTLTSRAEPSAVTVTVAVGGAITIRNQHGDRHRLRARDPEDVDTSDIEPGASASVSFPVAGRYVLVDERSGDPAYTVTVDVREPAASPTTPAPSTAGTDGEAPPPSRSATVSIPDRSFSPRAVTIAARGTVTWVNDDGSHTVTAEDRSWDSGVFDGGRFDHTFASAGTYAYLCLLHPEMRGTVEVVGASTSAPPTAAPSTGPTTGPTTPPAGDPATAPSAASRPAVGGASVAIRDFSFGPAALRVPVGTTVTWTNRGQAIHNVVSTGGGPLRSAYLEAGGSYRARLDRAGTFAYRCELHPDMTGRIVVTPAGAAGAPDAPSRPGASTDADVEGRPSPSPQSAEGSPAGTRHQLDIVDLAFAPATVTVAAGDEVVWENRDSAPHTVTSTGDGPLGSEMLRQGDRYEVVVTEPGTYAYLCAVHPEMTGELVVTAAGAAATDVPPPSDVAAPASELGGATLSASNNGDLGPVAAIMLFFMAVTFVVGRVTSRG